VTDTAAHDSERSTDGERALEALPRETVTMDGCEHKLQALLQGTPTEREHERALPTRGNPAASESRKPFGASKARAAGIIACPTRHTYQWPPPRKNPVSLVAAESLVIYTHPWSCIHHLPLSRITISRTSYRVLRPEA
jgi:hypothetical protein